VGKIIRTYPAYRSEQTPGGKPLIFFDAPAVEIEQWAGVPQRRRVSDDQDEQTAGFQREEDTRRVRQLTQFYGDHQNVVQNPLLGALQNQADVIFTPNGEGSPFGELTVAYDDYSELSFKALLLGLIDRLDSRVESLKNNLNDKRIAELLDRESQQSVDSAQTEAADAEDDEEQDTDEGELALGDDDSAEEPGDNASILLAEETQLAEFYTELVARVRILDLRGVEDAREVQGFTRDAVLEYLKPVALVDGQHRLRGAATAARKTLAGKLGQEALMDATTQGVDPDQAEADLLTRYSRRLPLSLLMDERPSEHVFQFVVVNQKATPLGPALLGTIVATSLSKTELHEVAQRLRNAGIKLDDSQAVTYLARAEGSPFQGLVQTGTFGDRPDMLQWTVLRGLVQIFRELRGGRPYNRKNDYARAWRNDCLPESGLVSEGTDRERYAEWSRPDGPWREVFIRFFAYIRDYFGKVDDPSAFNGWGSTKESNLFNKISLTILATDYFEYLHTKHEVLTDLDDFERTLVEWLQSGKVDEDYFNRDWKILTVKKDQAATKRLWADNWAEYRKVPTGKMPTNFKP